MQCTGVSVSWQLPSGPVLGIGDPDGCLGCHLLGGAPNYKLQNIRPLRITFDRRVTETYSFQYWKLDGSSFQTSPAWSSFISVRPRNSTVKMWKTSNQWCRLYNDVECMGRGREGGGIKIESNFILASGAALARASPWLSAMAWHFCVLVITGSDSKVATRFPSRYIKGRHRTPQSPL